MSSPPGDGFCPVRSGYCADCGATSRTWICPECTDAVQHRWPSALAVAPVITSEPPPDPDTWGALIRAERAAP